MAATQKRDNVGVSEIKNVDVRTNLSPYVALQGLTKNSGDYVVEKGR